MFSYLLIGSGRASRHFSHYLRSLEIPHASWARSQNSIEDLNSKLQKSQKVLLLISDGQIQGFAKATLSQFQGPVIHFSGALEIEGIISAHPLMSFGPELYDPKIYKNMHFAVLKGTSFQHLFPELPNPFFEICPEQKSLYHAWAVYSGNLASLLWKEAIPGFDRLGVPREAIATYLEQVLRNALCLPDLSLTGPLARKDKVTVEKHLSALPNSVRSIYKSFAHEYAPEVLP